MRSYANPADLLEGLRQGDADAFEALVREHIGPLRAVARRLLGNIEDADDAVQDAFVSTLQAVRRFEGRSQLFTWLHRITVNACLMKLRSRKRSPDSVPCRHESELMPRFTRGNTFLEHQVAWTEAPETPALRDELRTVVRDAIGRLPENSRIALLLRDIEGLSNEEVATALGITVNAAKIRIHRARQALRTLLIPWMTPASPP